MILRRNVSATLEGGGPMNLSGNIVLCSRDSLAIDGRFFSGSLAHLSLFDTALNSTEVYALYESVAGDSSQSAAAPAPENWLSQYSNDNDLQVRSQA